ncbi:Transposase, Ptta/En/Spm, plant [Quillaja saponaria]|uniref:Transposase, Ptta/En/Spm, plant n=1 Tax=Quillaja saponaria TaxID=32244 RepID=A0AAD7PUW9_QUISA|nr:Transposase, Ptta/En/Spm, plant [Quillaja saponaria]
MARPRKVAKARSSAGLSSSTGKQVSEPKKKGRGPTKGLKVQKKREKSADRKLDVLIPPSTMVAVGPGRKDFITDLSVIVHQNAPHNVYKWKQVPQTVKDTIVLNTLNNWRLQDTDLIRKAILKEANHLYRNWRNRLHDHYLMFEAKEEALKHIPDDVSESDWQFLVDYFGSREFEKVSSRNKANREKQRINHSCGPKSFLAVSYDARDPETGEEPDMQKLWQLTHRKANGEWVSEASKEINDKVDEKINEELQQLEVLGDGTKTVGTEVINAAFWSVVGERSGQVRVCGVGRRPSNSTKDQHLQAQLEVHQREAEEARKECDEVRAKLTEVESQLEEEQRKQEEMQAGLLDRQNQMQESINSQIQAAIETALSKFQPLTTESLMGSLSQRRRIEELELQLHEAEDLIIDLRTELKEVNEKFDMVKRLLS